MAPENRHAHPNYASGEDYILEFRSFRYGFNSVDFAQRVEMAASGAGLDRDPALFSRTSAPTWCSWSREAASSSRSVRLVSIFSVAAKTCSLCTARTWCTGCASWCSAVRGWICRLMEGQLEVAFDEDTGEFAYFPAGHRTRRIGPPPHPSWREVAYTR